MSRLGIAGGWMTMVLLACGGAATEPKPADGTSPNEAKATPSESSPPAASAASSASASADASGDDKKPIKKLSQPSGQKTAVPPVEIGETAEVTLGGKKIRGEVCALDTSLPVMQSEWFSKSVGEIAAGADGSLYLVDSEGKLRKYTPSKGEKCELYADRSFGKQGRLDVPGAKDGEDTKLSTDKAGNVFVSTNDEKLRLVGGKLSKLCGGYGTLRVDESGKGGTVSQNVVTFAPESCEGEAFEPKGFGDKDFVDSVAPFGKDFLVAGNVGDVKKVGVFDAKGNKKMLVGAKADGDEKICSTGYATKCAQGVCVIDANCRALRVWKTNGSFVGRIELMGSFAGLGYPWPVGIAFTKDAAYMSVSHDAKDKDAGSVGLVVRVKGLD